MRGRYRNSTLYLIKAKWAAVCSCGKEIKPGEEALYYPSSRTLECRDCAVPTLNALADERMMYEGV